MLTVAVLAYHTDSNTQLTDDCIASINKQILPDIPYKKLIIDNGSIPLIKDYKDWTTFHFTRNLGNIEGQNNCFIFSDTEWVLFVSNDVRFEPDAIANLWRERFQGQLIPIILNPDMSHQSFGGRLKWPGYGFNIRRRRVCQDYSLDYVPSITYLMPKDLWRKIGCFDEHYPMTYEDVDMGLRLGSSRLKCSNSAFAIHLGNATLGYSNNRKFVEGRRRLINKHYKGIDRLTRLLAVKLCSPITGKSMKII